MAYPVSVRIEPVIADRDRLTTAFRVILAIPHLVLVGGVGQEGGFLGAVMIVLAIVSWFTIVIAGAHILGIRQFTLFYLRWRVRVLAYIALLVDDYPPFGDYLPYPASIEVAEPIEARDRLTVAVRLLLVIPHAIVLAFVEFAWVCVTIVAWFAILITGRYPESMAAFSVGVIRWRLRVDAYTLLMVDQYPPFSLEE